MTGDPITSPIVGRYGRADLVPFDPNHPRAAETVTIWLIDAPGWTPAWSKYHLCAVRLRDNVPGMPAPRRHFDGATHEIVLMALNPDFPVTVEQLGDPDYQLQWLEPVNLVHQVEATDAEIVDLVGAMARGIVREGMAPEPPLGRASFRIDWAVAITKSLAHQRGETHAP